MGTRTARAPMPRRLIVVDFFFFLLFHFLESRIFRVLFILSVDRRRELKSHESKSPKKADVSDEISSFAFSFLIPFFDLCSKMWHEKRDKKNSI